MLDRSSQVTWLLFVWLSCAVYSRRACEDRHLQQQFCQYKSHRFIAALLEVVKEVADDKKRTYTTKVVKLLPEDEQGKVKVGNHLLVSTQFDSLAVGGFYVIGDILKDNYELELDICSLLRKWSELSKIQQEALTRGYYKQSCACVIEDCWDNPCERKSDTCYLNMSFDIREAECNERHSICYYDKEQDSCAWKTSDELDKCMDFEVMVPY